MSIIQPPSALVPKLSASSVSTCTLPEGKGCVNLSTLYACNEHPSLVRSPVQIQKQWQGMAGEQRQPILCGQGARLEFWPHTGQWEPF